MSDTDLRQRLADAVGTENLTDDHARLEFMSNDVYRGGGALILVVRPVSVATLQATVCLCATAGVAVVPRGGGASYTDG